MTSELDMNQRVRVEYLYWHFLIYERHRAVLEKSILSVTVVFFSMCLNKRTHEHQGTVKKIAQAHSSHETQRKDIQCCTNNLLYLKPESLLFIPHFRSP